MVIQFNVTRDKLFDSKLHRYKELNSMYFMQQEMSNAEIIEWNDLEIWLKVHNN